MFQTARADKIRPYLPGRGTAGLGAVLALAGALALPACGGGVTGTYVAHGKGLGDGDMTITLELKSGGVARLLLGGPGGQSLPAVTGTWTAEGDRITTILAKDRDEMVLKDGTLTMDMFDEQLVLRKQ